MVERLLKEFNFLYDDESVRDVEYLDSEQAIIIHCESGYNYKVSYNGGAITTVCLNY